MATIQAMDLDPDPPTTHHGVHAVNTLVWDGH